MQHPRLAWITGLQENLIEALGTSVIATVKDDVDPLKKFVVLELGEELGKGDYRPVQTIVHSFAKSNDCTVYRIRRAPKRLVLEVLTKGRLGPVMNKNPLR